MTRNRFSLLFSARKARRQRVLRKMATMRAAKERRRLDRGPADSEPKMLRYFPLDLGVRDKRTGETAWTDLRSVRDAARRLAVVLKFCS